MLDNLRDDADASPLYEDDGLPDFLEVDMGGRDRRTNDSSGLLKPILALSPLQRFIIAVMLFMTVCLIGSMLLLVTQRLAIF
ncbi:MAG: hypothetical protein HQ525_08005 [Anaerolineae bacterium]|nr:hypothetical protein [Anaerolineae bacterium]